MKRIAAVAVATLFVLLTLGVLFLPAYSANYPTQAEFQQASENIETPCYWLCGPWYTWLPTWVVALMAVAAAIRPIGDRIASWYWGKWFEP